MSLSLLISKYSWVLIVVGIIAWVTYMSLKRPVDPKANPDGKLSRLGLAIEKAKPIFANFQANVAATYGSKETTEEKPIAKQEPKKEEKKEEPKENPYETKIDKKEMFKPIDF